MSSPNHPTSDIEDAFSFTNIPDYTSASPDYFLASPRNNSLDLSNDLNKDLLASLFLSPFHDDPYMKVMQAYDVTNNKLPIPPGAPIAPPTVLPSSSVLPLSLMFDPQKFFLSEELLPPKIQAYFLSLSYTNLSAQPQAFEIGEIYHGTLDMSYTLYEEQIKDILSLR
nr:hypothetical protein [Tanacetum cinerariifolium]